MNKQIVIAISREFGSGGHTIAEKLAEHYNIPLYDKEMMYNIDDAKLNFIDTTDLKGKPVKLLEQDAMLASGPITLNERFDKMTFNYLETKAFVEKESFVAIGRCADSILKEHPNLIRIFVRADLSKKVDYVKELFNLNEKQALKKIAKEDKRRKTYHNFYADHKWGDSRGYDICINSSKFGIEKTVEALIAYIDIERELIGHEIQE